MVIDTSALIAILLAEPELRSFVEAIDAAPRRLVSAASAVETGIVIKARKGASGGREFDLFVQRAPGNCAIHSSTGGDRTRGMTALRSRQPSGRA